MSFYDDLFGGGANDDDLPNDGLDDGEINDEDRVDGDQNDENGDGKKEVTLEIKKKRVARPRNILNADKLKGPRGILEIETYFKNVKFHGKGREREDLDVIMKKLEHWAHRLFPKYNLDDTLAVIENIGKKQVIHTYMNRYRMGMLEEEKPANLSDDEQLEYPEHVHNLPLDPFDSMLEEQISKTRYNLDTSGVSPLNETRWSQRTTSPPPPPPREQLPPPSPPRVLTEEEKAKIAANRLKALEIQKAKREAREREAREKEMANQSGIDVFVDEEF